MTMRIVIFLGCLCLGAVVLAPAIAVSDKLHTPAEASATVAADVISVEKRR